MVMMDLLDVLLMALSVMAVRKVHGKPTEPPAFRNNSKDSPTAEPGTQRLRLMNGGSRCSGKVELEYNGTWGMVCDDNWDLTDATVVCRQLGCGWAIQALNASYFQKGTGPIHLGEVKCSGSESYLWDCPSVKNPDCGYTGEAGVICSDHQAWRLSGGLDSCAGRVEVYYRGIWNTVCDSSWYQDEANVLCRSLGCSNKASTPRVPFNHTLPGKMYYECSGDEDSLTICKWRYNRATLCDQFRAAGVICNGSLGLSTDTTVTEAVTPAVTSVSHTPNPCWTKPENWDLKPSYQMLHILCIVLSLLLFLAILSHIITVLLNRRRTNGTLDCAISSASISAPVLVNHSVQVSATGGGHNDYREIPTSFPKGEATAAKPTPLSEDSDSDYERYDFSDKPPMALSTFYNSLRHRAPEENLPPCNFGISAVHKGGETERPGLEGHHPQEAGPIAEESDSTSSGDAEWYENIQRPEYQRDHPGNEPCGGLTTFSRPLVNCEAGPENGSFNSSDYDDMWS